MPRSSSVRSGPKSSARAKPKSSKKPKTRAKRGARVSPEQSTDVVHMRAEVNAVILDEDGNYVGPYKIPTKGPNAKIIKEHLEGSLPFPAEHIEYKVDNGEAIVTMDVKVNHSFGKKAVQAGRALWKGVAEVIRLAHRSGVIHLIQGNYVGFIVHHVVIQVNNKKVFYQEYLNKWLGLGSNDDSGSNSEDAASDEDKKDKKKTKKKAVKKKVADKK